MELHWLVLESVLMVQITCGYTAGAGVGRSPEYTRPVKADLWRGSFTGLSTTT